MTLAVGGTLNTNKQSYKQKKTKTLKFNMMSYAIQVR